MVCFRYISVNTLHTGDNKDNNNNNTNNILVVCNLCKLCVGVYVLSCTMAVGRTEEQKQTNVSRNLVRSAAKISMCINVTFPFSRAAHFSA
jgi:hypothetical protein